MHTRLFRRIKSRSDAEMDEFCKNSCTDPCGYVASAEVRNATSAYMIIHAQVVLSRRLLISA